MSQYFRYPPAASISLSNYALETGGNLEDIKNILDVGSVTVTGNWLTDAELRASPVPVSGPLTDVQLRATPVPVSGPLTDVQLRASAVPVSAASLPLPSGAATSTNQTDGSQKSQIVNSSNVSIDARQLGVQVVSTDVGLITNSVIHGLTTAGGGSYVDVKVNPSGALSVDASGSTVAATQSGTWNITNISGTVSLPTGAATETTLSALNTKIPSNLTVTSTRLLVDGSGVTQPVSGTVTSTQIASSSSVTSVASSASSVSILASNSSRRGAMFYNDSTQICYLKLGTTASSSSYTVQLAAGAYYELPPGYIYTGAIDAIWASANGNLRVTELS